MSTDLPRLRSTRLSMALMLAATTATAGELQLLSTLEDPLVLGTQANQRSDGCSMSALGRYVAFTSYATNLIPNAPSGSNVYVKDRQSGLLRLIAPGREVSMSLDGRSLALVTSEDLINGGMHSSTQLYHLDRPSQTLRLASKDSAGQPTGTGLGIYLSGGGRYIAFESGDDVYRYDSVTDTSELISTDAGGVTADARVNVAGIADNGDNVVLDSSASNLVPGDTNGAHDVFVKQVSTGAIVRASVSDAGTEVAAGAYAEGISGDGQSVLFRSRTPFTIGEPSQPDTSDIYRHLLTTGSTELVSANAQGEPGNADSLYAANGQSPRFNAFASRADNLGVPSAGNYQAYFRDMQSGGIELLASGADDIWVEAISATGDYVCVRSDAHDLVAGDNNREQDIFVIDRGTGDVERINLANTAIAVAKDDENSDHPVVDAAGGRVVFLSRSALIDADATESNARYNSSSNQLYLYDLTSGERRLISQGPDGQFGDDNSERPRISPNGRYLVFHSRSTNLTADITGSERKIFRADLDTQELIMISIEDDSTALSVADDGSVVFILEDSDHYYHPFLWRGPNDVEQISSRPTGIGHNSNPKISANARYIMFDSRECDVVANDCDGSARYRLYVHDLQSDTIRFLDGGTHGIAEFDATADGLLAVFQSDQSDVGVFLIDAETGRVTTVIENDPEFIETERPMISPNGRYVLFRALESATGDTHQLLRFDVERASLTRVTGLPGVEAYESQDIDDYGRVLFATADPLLPEDPDDRLDVYRVCIEPESTATDAIFRAGFEGCRD